MPAQQAERVRSWLSSADHLSGHVFILTSGSTAASEADFKWVALSKQAVLAAAVGANQHLFSKGATGEASAVADGTLGEHRSTRKEATHDRESTNLDPRPSTHDTWLNCLPDFHVGGLGVWARALLSGAKVVRLTTDRWNPSAFVATATETRTTLSSLVPTQVHDLVEAELSAPTSLRAIVVGGAALAEDTYRQARQLGWPLLPSYGMTEAASQIATADLQSLATPGQYPSLTVLPHLEVMINLEDSRIKVRGASLLTGIVRPDASGVPKFFDPKDAAGWLTTDDFGAIRPRGLTVIGRVQDRVKIGGEVVNLAALRRTLDEEAGRLGIAQGVALGTSPDARLESVIALIVEAAAPSNAIAKLQKAFDSRVMPYERIRDVRRIAKIPRTELGKIKWSELSALAQEQ